MAKPAAKAICMICVLELVMYESTVCSGLPHDEETILLVLYAIAVLEMGYSIAALASCQYLTTATCAGMSKHVTDTVSRCSMFV